MNKKNKIIIISAFLILAAIAGYFFADRKGLLPKKNISYSRTISEIQSEKSDQSSVEQEKIKQEDAEPSKTRPIDEKDALEKLQPSETPSKVVEKKAEEPAKQEDSNDVGKIVDKLMSGGFQKSSGRKIDTIIVHTSYNAIGEDKYDIDDIIKQYEQYNVSAHYLISRDGTIYRLVKDENIAWHAGASKMPDGRTNINDFSIGIEVVNTKEGKFSDAEYEALNSLISSLKKKYSIKNILGHDDIAPGRKTDPWGIEWGKVKK